jgi:hypothetical protein
MRKSYVQLPDLRLVEKGSDEHLKHLESTVRRAPVVIPDEGDFVSPIDQRVYSGRAGMREHNKRHNVINNRDLVGLPYQTVNTPIPDQSKAIRGEVIKTMKQKGYL